MYDSFMSSSLGFRFNFPAWLRLHFYLPAYYSNIEWYTLFIKVCIAKALTTFANKQPIVHIDSMTVSPSVFIARLCHPFIGVHCMYNVHCVHCTLYVHCVHCKIYSVHCTVYNSHGRRSLLVLRNPLEWTRLCVYNALGVYNIGSKT